ncbi:uncharacterized protein LOC132526071 [Lagenorhynchus albirostris]|uniref:uncharacterized protein LOC132526071 n=1 Tax=Lagenorhynchus albirostris TaxID=27610 RepID=UPI0028EA1C24|nr:uncharacterized protein LOC132526071 [Lagenorhynchus albirostris]
MWDGAGLLGATIAPFPGDVTQGELLHPLPGSLCSHPGILRFFSVLPLQFASTPLAAGHCLQEALVKYPRITWEQLAHRSTQWLFTRASRHARHQSSVITDRRCLSQASSLRCFSFPFQRSYKAGLLRQWLWGRDGEAMKALLIFTGMKRERTRSREKEEMPVVAASVRVPSSDWVRRSAFDPVPTTDAQKIRSKLVTQAGSPAHLRIRFPTPFERLAFGRAAALGPADRPGSPGALKGRGRPWTPRRDKPGRRPALPDHPASVFLT